MSAGVYLAMPIDQGWSAATGSEVTDWLREQPEVSWVFHPGLAFSTGGSKERTPAIRQIDNTALDQADAMVAFLPAGTPSIGVPMEIERAVAAGKPVLVISDAPSWMLEFGLPSVLVRTTWDGLAREWLLSALRGVSRDLGGPRRVPVPVVVEKGSEGPRRGYDDDAGLDLVVSEDTVIWPRKFVDVPCGCRVQLPSWSWGMITGRSSTLRKRGLLVNQGIIDPGYRGPLFAGVWNLGDAGVKVLKGERIAQLLVIHNMTRLVEPYVTAELEPGTRGEAGFGSTGT